MKKRDRKEIGILKMFLDQGMESLTELEKEILKLEIHAEDINLINRSFHRIHIIKGGASFLGLTEMVRLSFEMEMTLKAINEKRIKVTGELIDSLLLVVERLKAIIEKLKKVKPRDLEKCSKYLKSHEGDEVLEKLKIACSKSLNEEQAKNVDETENTGKDETEDTWIAQRGNLDKSTEPGTAKTSVQGKEAPVDEGTDLVMDKYPDQNIDHANYNVQKNIEQDAHRNLDKGSYKLENKPPVQEKGSEEEGGEILESEEFAQGLIESLKEQFQYESTEYLELIENQLLIQLDQDGGNQEVLQELFRTVHSLKGGIGIYLAALPCQTPQYQGLKKFSEVVHSFESLLALVRDQRYPVHKDLINLGYKVTDYAKEILYAVVTDDWSKPIEEGLVEEIEDYMRNLHLSQEPEGSENSHEKEGPVEEDEGRAEDERRADKKDWTKNLQQSQSIRVNQEKIDQMMNMISELVIAKNSFMHLSTKLDREYDLPEISKEVKKVGAHVNRISDELQNAIMSIRMVEIKSVFQKMPRVVRDIAQATGKKMELIIEGEGTEIDKTIIERISDPLVHLIRNAADHGIESIEERQAKGKPVLGKIILRAYNKNKHVCIEIEDDGKGIDAQQIKEKAIGKGFVTRAEAEKMSQSQLLNMIFLPGFSTANKITEVSGRGVGMDIVKSNISQLKGTITIESKVDVGTKMIIQLPLTLAVSRGLIVEALGESYIFPLEYIAETVKIDPQAIYEYDGKCFTHLRGEVMGIEWLSKVFLTGDRVKGEEKLNAVIITNGQEKCALVVDRFKGEQEFVVKTLDGHLANIPGISGSTILGNGKVILIVNPLEIFRLI